MWNLICISILFAILVLSSTIIFVDRKRRALANRIPGPEGSFLIGMLPLYLQGPEEICIYFPKLYETYEKSTFKFWLFNFLHIFITQPEDIEFVLNNPKLQLKSKEYKAVQESGIGQGIFAIDDIDKWKKNRKIVTRGLRFTALKSFIPIFYDEAMVLNQILNKTCDLNSKECEISFPISMATMEMIGRTAFDVKFNAQFDKSHRVVESVQGVLLTWEYRFTHPWYLNKTIFRLSAASKKDEQCKKNLIEFSNQLIKDKLAELNRNANDNEKSDIAVTDNDDDYRKPITVIESLLDSHNEMSQEQIRDELITVIIAGQDTTAMASALVIFMLAHHQDIQQKVFEELQSIFSVGDYERVPTHEDLLQMEYLDRVIKETLRLFPSAPLFARKLEEDMQIGKYLCPAGSSLAIVPYCIHRSPQHYTDPLKFNPDNFLPEACQRRHPYTYIPFSAGHRNCVGSKYAMIQMKTVLSTLMRKSKFHPSDRCPSVDDLRIMYLITLKFADKCYVKIERRM